MKSLLTVGLLTALVSLPHAGRADVSGFSVPTIRNLPESSYAGWEVFTAAKDVGNRPDLAGSTGDARILQTTPTAIVTGSGNIYNPGGPSSFVVSKATRVPIDQIVFQTRTVAVEIDYTTVTL